MKLRSKGLAVLGIVLLAIAGALGAVLVHDGESQAASDLAAATAGDDVAVKGRPEPFHPDDLARWSLVRPFLGAQNYLLPTDGGLVVLLVADTPAPGGIVLAQGTVLLAAPHPTQADALLLVVHVDDWREPLLFR